ncbi:MAG: RNHCP domain-containing protein [Clostridia bacterium]|nr:RNHCP domain-containing protein [Clostridia bacterium]
MERAQFTKIDEEFICENCGTKVQKLGYSCRNHCPICLCSKHVDKNPGDREEECHGLLKPIRIEINPKKGYVIIFKCIKCGAIRKNKAAEDDNLELIYEIMRNGN